MSETCTGAWLNAHTNLRVRATYGLCSGVEFSRLDAGGIGIASVIQAGFLDAVDVWGWVRPTVEICFPQMGAALFLDASTSPRIVSPIASYLDGIYTCVEISKAGTVTLVAADSGRSTASIARDTELPLSNCMVTTQYNLNLRQRPNGTVLMVVPYGATLTVFERTPGWYKVDYHGERGWLSGGYVTPVGSCG